LEKEKFVADYSMEERKGEYAYNPFTRKKGKKPPGLKKYKKLVNAQSRMWVGERGSVNERLQRRRKEVFSTWDLSKSSRPQ